MKYAHKHTQIYICIYIYISILKQLQVIYDKAVHKNFCFEQKQAQKQKRN
jgi:hypothetical protein